MIRALYESHILLKFSGTYNFIRHMLYVIQVQIISVNRISRLHFEVVAELQKFPSAIIIFNESGNLCKNNTKKKKLDIKLRELNIGSKKVMQLP